VIGVVVVALALVLAAIVGADAYAYWRRAHALDGLVDPRVLRAMRARVEQAHAKLRANRVNG